MTDERFCYYVGLACVAGSICGEWAGFSELRMQTTVLTGIILLSTGMVLRGVARK